MQYRWRKSELYFKYLLGYILRNPNYRYTISSLLKQYDLSHPKGHLEKYSLDESDYDYLVKKDYFFDDIELIPSYIIEKCQNIYLNWENTAYFQQEFSMPRRYFTVKELMSMLDDIIMSINNPDILREYQKLMAKKNRTFNIQTGNKNTKGELSISGMTIYDSIFHKNYINLLREYNAEDIITLTHETLHAIFNLLLYEHGINYDDQQLFIELEGYFGTLLATNHLSTLGYIEDAKCCRRSYLDSTLFLSLALSIGEIIFASSIDSFDIPAAVRMAKVMIPEDHYVDFQENYESYINFPALDMIIDIIDYAVSLELSNRPLDEAIKSIIDIKLHNKNNLMANLNKHNIMFPKDDFAILKKEFTEIK